MKHTHNLGASLAPQPVHIAELMTVLCDELHAALFIGWGTRLTSTMPVEPTPMYVDRLDFNRDEPEKGCGYPPVIQALSFAALGNAKDWAKDVNAFYNNDLLHEAVVDLIADWFNAGWDATNLEPAIESLTLRLEEATAYQANIKR